MHNTVLITGAAGWLGGLLARALHTDPGTSDVHLILVDVVEPKVPVDVKTIAIRADLTDRVQVEALFKTDFGIPDTIYCFHGMMSRGAEDNFELGVKVNIDSVRSLLEITRIYSGNTKPPVKFIFASSLAVYGGPLPDIVTPLTAAIPQGSYGVGKLTSELMVNEYSRRKWVDGRILRLPTVVVRAGAPSTATSAFISSIISEPLRGQEAICPIGDSFDSAATNLCLWLSSAETVIKNFVIAKHLSADRLMPHTRVICLPGFTATVREELEALEKVAGLDALKLVKFRDDPTNRRIVSSWPALFDNEYPLSLGFFVDEGGMVPIVRQFKDSMNSLA